MKIIDAHVQVGDGYRMKLEAEELIKMMDDANIAFAIASPVDRFTAVANHEGNNYLIDAIKKHPDRLAGMATANPWFGEAAVDEIKRALDKGLSGIYIHSVLQGFRLGEHIVDPVLEVAAKYDVPVYAHTGTAGVAEPFHLIELSRRFPTVNIMMGHGGSSDYYNDAVRGMEFAQNVWIES